MSKKKLNYIKYCTGHYYLDGAKKMADDLRESGEYLHVKLGNYQTERLTGKRTCQIYVATKDLNSPVVPR